MYMSTSSPNNTVERASESAYSAHHHRGAVAFLAAVGYAAAVTVSGSPVALLAGLFVPFSLGAESAFRAAHGGSSGRRAEALSTGLGVIVGAVATGAVVFGAGVL